MYPANFEYLRPSTVDEAIAMLVKHGDAAKLLAGGHSLIPAMKLRLARPKVIIDIGRLGGLSYVRESNGAIAIGAMTTHYEIESSAVLRDRSPLLAETARRIGDVQVRNKGTIGGSLVHADPAADYPAAVLALDAEFEVAGPKGRRTIPARSFFVDLLQTAVGPGEILVEVRVPVTARTVAYEKTEQKASGFALAGVAVVAGRDGVRIGVTGVAATAYRATAAEQALTGPPSPAAIASAAMRVADGVDALADIHASAEYRVHLAQVNAKRALTRALGAA
jgi:aerobic carbon-monoxide dehydrogenase medium subunit